jgi:hypothetical protein
MATLRPAANPLPTVPYRGNLSILRLSRLVLRPNLTMSPTRPYHLARPDSPWIRMTQPGLCGTEVRKLVASSFLYALTVPEIVKPEEICGVCFGLYHRHSNLAAGPSWGRAFPRPSRFSGPHLPLLPHDALEPF